MSRDWDIQLVKFEHQPYEEGGFFTASNMPDAFISAIIARFELAFAETAAKEFEYGTTPFLGIEVECFFHRHGMTGSGCKYADWEVRAFHLLDPDGNPRKDKRLSFMGAFTMVEFPDSLAGRTEKEIIKGFVINWIESTLQFKEHPWSVK